MDVCCMLLCSVNICRGYIIVSAILRQHAQYCKEVLTQVGIAARLQSFCNRAEVHRPGNDFQVVGHILHRHGVRESATLLALCNSPYHTQCCRDIFPTGALPLGPALAL